MKNLPQARRPSGLARVESQLDRLPLPWAAAISLALIGAPTILLIKSLLLAL